MKKLKYTTSAIGVALLFLSGCSTEPKVMNYSEDMPTTTKKAAEKLMAEEEWSGPGVVSEGKSGILIYAPTSIPKELAENTKIDIEDLESGTTVQDIIGLLANMKVSIVTADEAVLKKSVYIPRYKGNLGGFLSAISKATDLWFTWENGAILVSSKEKIGISIPQEKKFAEAFAKELGSLGIKSGFSSQQAALGFVELSPSEYRRVASFINRFTSNASVVAMQVAILNVSLNQNAKQGIDWEKLQIAGTAGGNASQFYNMRNTFSNAPTSGTTNGTGTIVNNTTSTTGTTGTTTTGGTTTGTTTTTNNAWDRVAGLSLLNNGMQLAFFGNRFSLSGVFNFLQTYGETETNQSLLLKAFSGNTVQLKSLTKIPYVSEIGVTTGATTTTTSTGSLANSTASSKTDKANDGISVEITPTYDSYGGTVTMEVKIKLEAVIAFNDLSAGNQIGKLTQPTTAEREFESTVLVRPGQTAIIGGLSYYSVGNNSTNPLFLTNSALADKLKSLSLTVNKQSMFIALRPTVTKLGRILEQEKNQMEPEYIESGVMPPAEPEPVKKGSKK